MQGHSAAEVGVDSSCRAGYATSEKEPTPQNFLQSKCYPHQVRRIRPLVITRNKFYSHKIIALMPSVSDLQLELKELLNKLQTINETLNKIADCISDEEIGVGSRVLITHLSKPIEGRVWRVKANDIFAINRDGYAAEILVQKKNLKHLSVGTYGKLEKQQWLLQNRILNLQREIEVQINKNVFGIKELLCKGIDFSTARTILKRKDFQRWYKSNNCDQCISLEDLTNASPIFICGLAREFIIAAPNLIIWQSIIYTHSR